MSFMSNDTGSGVATGLASLAGLGELYDPLAELRGDLMNAQNDMQNLLNTSNFASIKQNTDNDGKLFSYIQTNSSAIKKTIIKYNNIAMDGIQKQNFFTSILSILVIVLVFFRLIK
jgi:hypothetical protein